MTTWEDAVDNGLVAVEGGPGRTRRQGRVMPTEKGLALLKRRLPAVQVPRIKRASFGRNRRRPSSGPIARRETGVFRRALPEKGARAYRRQAPPW